MSKENGGSADPKIILASRVKDLKRGDLLPVNNMYRVTKIGSEWVHCDTVGTGHGIKFSTSLVESAVASAGQFKEERKVTATELAKVAENAGHAVFTCTFIKKPMAKIQHMTSTRRRSRAARKR